MNLSVTIAALLAAAHASGPLAAQGVHDGWLCEVLDLDIERARSFYAEAADDATTPTELRTLALARQLDLSPDPRHPDLADLRRELFGDPIVIPLLRDPATAVLWGRFGRSGRPERRPPPPGDGPPREPENDGNRRSSDPNGPVGPSLFAALIPEVEGRLGSGRDREIRQLLDQIVQTWRKPDGAAERDRLRAQLTRLAPERSGVDRRHYALTLLRYQLAGREDLAKRFAQQFPEAEPRRPRSQRPIEDRLRWAMGVLPDVIRAAPSEDVRETLAELERQLEHHEGSAETLAPILDTLSSYLFASGFHRRGRRRR